MLPAIVALGALGAAVLSDRSKGAERFHGEAFGAPGTYMTPERAAAGRDAVTDDDFTNFLDTAPGEFRKLFKLPDFAAKALLKAKKLGHLSKEIIRGDMRVMPGWFQQAYASKWFAGSIDAMLTEISAVTGVSVPRRT